MIGPERKRCYSGPLFTCSHGNENKHRLGRSRDFHRTSDIVYLGRIHLMPQACFDVCRQYHIRIERQASLSRDRQSTAAADLGHNGHSAASPKMKTRDALPCHRSGTQRGKAAVRGALVNSLASNRAAVQLSWRSHPQTLRSTVEEAVAAYHKAPRPKTETSVPQLSRFVPTIFCVHTQLSPGCTFTKSVVCPGSMPTKRFHPSSSRSDIVAPFSACGFQVTRSPAKCSSVHQSSRRYSMAKARTVSLPNLVVSSTSPYGESPYCTVNLPEHSVYKRSVSPSYVNTSSVCMASCPGRRSLYCLPSSSAMRTSEGRTPAGSWKYVWKRVWKSSVETAEEGLVTRSSVSRVSLPTSWLMNGEGRSACRHIVVRCNAYRVVRRRRGLAQTLTVYVSSKSGSYICSMSAVGFSARNSHSPRLSILLSLIEWTKALGASGLTHDCLRRIASFDILPLDVPCEAMLGDLLERRFFRWRPALPFNRLAC